LAQSVGLIVDREYSFPFPRQAGRIFKYNEFVMVAKRPEYTAPAFEGTEKVAQVGSEAADAVHERIDR
jgi:hypothetical protein